jgi:CRISPR/Cas system CMR-associated protein Cmr1 (group 7 of RAMP superfamily)
MREAFRGIKAIFFRNDPKPLRESEGEIFDHTETAIAYIVERG